MSGLTSRMLEHIKNYTDDKIVLISNATQTLDLMEKLCRAKKSVTIFHALLC
jgi:DNA repair and recombination RAD54-like protein